MKYHIDTIPVWDAYKAGHDCPMCALRDDNEGQLVELFLGESVMEPDRRVEVNAKGFCARHLQMMFTAGNRLGLALMCHTHLKETITRFESASATSASARRGLLGGLMRLNRQSQSVTQDAMEPPASSPNTTTSAASSISSPLASLSSRCVFCERLEYTINRYLYTLIHLWRSDSEFRAKLSESRGLCMPHYAALLDMASHQLSGAAYNQFQSTLHEVQTRDLEKLEKDIEWFTLKFDYRNQNKPWGDSKDAVERVMNKLRGKCVSGE